MNQRRHWGGVVLCHLRPHCRRKVFSAKRSTICQASGSPLKHVSSHWDPRLSKPRMTTVPSCSNCSSSPVNKHTAMSTSKRPLCLWAVLLSDTALAGYLSIVPQSKRQQKWPSHCRRCCAGLNDRSIVNLFNHRTDRPGIAQIAVSGRG